MLKICRLDEYSRQIRTSQWLRRKLSKNSNADNQIDGCRWQKPCGEDTGIQIYNHAVRGKVPLVLRNPNMVTWYTCGPTVYDKTHVGHASTFVKVDIIQRILRDYFKYNLVTAGNITDVDDKIIKRSRETGRNWLELAQAYAAEFKLDMQRLNVKPPNLRAHVSDNIATIQGFIEQLLATQQAYVSKDNSVYFDVSSCASYGKLEKLSQLQQESNPPSSDKRAAADFALWKAKKVDDGEPSWEASWGGVGRPGWHIECSAIAGKFFGRQLDIHAGGLDLRFPHHENEEAQCCAHYKTDQWVNYWLHTGQLHLVGDEQKMSKSLGNTISVEEMLTKYTADEFRMACLLSNYRNAMPYGDSLMHTARQTLRKFKNFHADLSAYMQFQKPLKLLDEGALQAQLKHTMLEFDNSLRDDFDTARALTVLMDQMSSISRCINDQQSDAEQEPSYCLDLLVAAGNFIGNVMQNFGITPFGQEQQEQLHPTTDINALIGDLLAVRRQLRDKAIGASVIQNRQLLAVCDQLRDLLQRHGFQVRDHKLGSSWTLIEEKSASSSA